MILIKYLFLILVGLAAGSVVAGGVFAFITMIGIIPRLASRTITSKYIALYESAIIWGAVSGNIVNLFHIPIPIGMLGLIISGLCIGVFVGCLAIALAEALDVFPIFSMRIKLVEGFPLVILSLALGKMFGVLFQMVLGR